MWIMHLAKRKTASVRIEIEQITVSRFERRNTGICVKSAVRTFFCCWGKRSEAEGEIFTKAVYIRGDSAEYYASLTYDKDCVLSTPEGGTLIAGYNQFASVNGVAEQARADREEVERFREELRRLKESRARTDDENKGQ